MRRWLSLRPLQTNSVLRRLVEPLGQPAIDDDGNTEWDIQRAEYLEREALTTMGVEDTLISVELRDWLESLNLPVTRRINGIVLQALDLTRYDDRLQLFLQHQLSSREQAEQVLQEAEVDSDGQAILRSISDAHTSCRKKYFPYVDCAPLCRHN